MAAQDRAQVKRFVAPTMRRALDLVGAEMGPEAVILSSRKVPEGVEVITAVEPDLPTSEIGARRDFGRHFDAELDTAMSSDAAWQTHAGIEQAAAKSGARVEMNEPSISASRSEELAREIELARERMLDAKRRAKATDAPAPRAQAAEPTPTQAHASQASRTPNARAPIYPDSALQDAQVQAELGDSRSSAGAVQDDARLEQLQSDIADMRMLIEQQMWQMARRPEVSMPGQVQMPGRYSVINDRLARLGLPDALADRLLESAGQQSSMSKTWRQCMAHLSRQLPIAGQDLVQQGGVFAFVGQTGVGKTTTIAKLAARYVLDHGPGKVALITTDTYRVGAYDQLRSLGRILNVPVRAVDAEHSLLRVLASLKQFPLILIDTAGFRHGDPLLKEQLRKLDSCPAVKRALVLACNSQRQTMTASTHAYASRQGIDACVLTKLDEAASLGEALSVLVERQLPVAYTTNGQEIPRDIARASAHQLVATAVALLRAEGDQHTSQTGG